MKKLVYLVRHAQYHNPRKIFPGRLPVPLSQEGRKEADRLREYFQDKGIEKIYSSAVYRCKQTAAIISDDTIPIHHDQRLLETFSAYQGYWGLENNPLTDWDEFYIHREELGGESYRDIQNRVVSFFNEMMVHPEKTVIVCSHGDPLQMLYYHLIGKPLPSETDDEGELVNEDYQKKGSVRLLEVEDGQYHFHPIVTQALL